MSPYFALMSQFLSPLPKGTSRGGLSDATEVRSFFLCDHLWLMASQMGSSLCFGEIYFLNFTHQWDQKPRKEESHSRAINWDQLKEQDDERKVIMEISSNPINVRLKTNKRTLSWGRRQSQKFFNKNLLPMLLLPLLLLLVFPVLCG